MTYNNEYDDRRRDDRRRVKADGLVAVLVQLRLEEAEELIVRKSIKSLPTAQKSLEKETDVGVTEKLLQRNGTLNLKVKI